MVDVIRVPSQYGELTSLSFHPNADTFEEWLEIGRTFRSLHNSVLWWVGDWLVWGNKRWGEKYSQAMEETDYSYDQLRRAYAVSTAFPPNRRRARLSWSHHREVLYLMENRQEWYLDKCEDEDWSSHRLREEISLAKIEAEQQLQIGNRIEQEAESDLLTPDEQKSAERKDHRKRWSERHYFYPADQFPEIESWLYQKVDTIWLKSDADKVAQWIARRDRSK